MIAIGFAAIGIPVTDHDLADYRKLLPSAASLRSAATKERKKIPSRFGKIRSLFVNDLLFTTKARVP